LELASIQPVGITTEVCKLLPLRFVLASQGCP
jgi:hypothetical protein